jgi:acyl-CoA thioester hydrolase
MIEVYRGSANTWECDEMGHMNVRFYLARMMEGLAEFCYAAGLPEAFRSRASSTLLPRDQHIRFVREALPGKPLVMRACVLEVSETSALIYQELRHSDGTGCAAFRTWTDHVDAQTGLAYPWPPRTRELLERLRAQAPSDLAPRSLDPDAPPRAHATNTDADSVQAPVIGRCVVAASHCDVFGRMAPEFFIGRISDSVSHLLAPWRATFAETPEGAPRLGGAVLEYRLVYRKWPRAGDRLLIRSALGTVEPKTHSFIHWVLDPGTGSAWCTCEALAVTLDLDRRKIVPSAPERIAALQRAIPQGLTI